MALKDLIVQSDEELEKRIEAIVIGRINYELELHEIVFTVQGSSLSNSAKVLVYLIAVLGWQYVDKNFTGPPTKPADLQEAIGIPGNTLRPILKKLTDDYLIKKKDGEYSVRLSNFAVIEHALSLSTKSTSEVALKSSPRTKSRKRDASRNKPTSNKKSGVRIKSRIPIRTALQRLIDDGYFDEYRTLAQIKERLSESALNFKITSISGPIAEFVRKGNLQRKKVLQNKGSIWAYKTV